MFLMLFSQLKNVGKDFAYQPDVIACFYRRHEANISRNLERQFMMIDEVLTHLCPTEWRDAAYLKNFAGHAIAAVRSGKLFLAERFFHATVAHMGLLRWLRAAGPALIDSLTNMLSNRLTRKILILHEPAATRMDDPSDRPCGTAVPGSL
jgi:hypothetical protein